MVFVRQGNENMKKYDESPLKHPQHHTHTHTCKYTNETIKVLETAALKWSIGEFDKCMTFV